jgi:hypothetical protein
MKPPPVVKPKKSARVTHKAKPMSTVEEIREFQMLLTHKIGSPFCTNVLRIALN